MGVAHGQGKLVEMGMGSVSDGIWYEGYLGKGTIIN
jgi:hypothetical protein